MSRRRARRAEFKARVALEVVKGLKTINEIAREYEPKLSDFVVARRAG